ncbi:hypothetical protein IW01_06605 [Pectobacterium brasiliense]|nr:hypothetical protein IW01_06605 [Pectobacterium brasiliense]
MIRSFLFISIFTFPLSSYSIDSVPEIVNIKNDQKIVFKKTNYYSFEKKFFLKNKKDIINLSSRKDECIEDCWSFTLPSRQGDAFEFNNCVNDCMGFNLDVC